MKIVAFDSETHRLRPGMVCPRPVCLSFTDDGTRLHLVDRVEGLALLRRWLDDADLRIVGYNLPYDLAAFAAEDPDHFVPRIFDGYEKGRLRCGMVRQALIDISQGQHKFRRMPDGSVAKTDYELATLVDYYFGRKMEGKDGDLRRNYGSLDGVPIAKWSDEAREYAMNDALEHWNVWHAQQRAWDEDGADVPDEIEQNKASWALRLAGAWGLRTDAPAVADLRSHLERDLGEITTRLQKLNLVREDGSRDMAMIQNVVEAAYLAQERRAPRTPTGRIKTSDEILIESGDEDLALLASTKELRTNLSRYVPMLELGTTVPMTPGWITTVETGRVACREPNIMNPPRKGKVRNCIVPRPGFVLGAADYDAAELRSWAQACIDLVGYSSMATAIREGHDLHLRLAADLLAISEEEAIRRYKDGDEIVDLVRQLCKIPNFGLPGGMGAVRLLGELRKDKKLLAAIEKTGIVVNFDFATRVVETWKQTWAEAPKYFQHVNALLGPVGEATIRQLRSGRIRGNVGYCDCANSFFQGLTADGAKAALWAVSRECYTAASSPLYGSRIVIFLHDELILEMPEDRASEAAKRLAEVMCEEMSRFLPDVPVTATPVLMRRWTKGAKPIYVDGRLVPSKAVKTGDKTTWVADLPERMAA